MVPLEVPASTMFTPGMGFPCSSFTEPEILTCYLEDKPVVLSDDCELSE